MGKTNAKLTLIDPALGQEVWSTRRANNVVQGAAGRELDVVAIEALAARIAARNAPGRERIAVIVPIAHGAAAVLVDRAGEVVVAPDYEDPCFDEVSAQYLPLRDDYSLTFSPSLPLGLNLGRQLFYLQTRRADLFQRSAHVLLYPQYWSWRLSGAMAAEFTSLGTHTPICGARTNRPIRRWPANRAGRACCRRSARPPIDWVASGKAWRTPPGSARPAKSHAAFMTRMRRTCAS